MVVAGVVVVVAAVVVVVAAVVVVVAAVVVVVVAAVVVVVVAGAVVVVVVGAFVVVATAVVVVVGAFVVVATAVVVVAVVVVVGAFVVVAVVTVGAFVVVATAVVAVVTVGAFVVGESDADGDGVVIGELMRIGVVAAVVTADSTSVVLVPRVEEDGFAADEVVTEAALLRVFVTVVAAGAVEDGRADEFAFGVCVGTTVIGTDVGRALVVWAIAACARRTMTLNESRPLVTGGVTRTAAIVTGVAIVDRAPVPKVEAFVPTAGTARFVVPVSSVTPVVATTGVMMARSSIVVDRTGASVVVDTACALLGGSTA